MKEVLLSNVRVSNTTSPYHNKSVSILIKDGTIQTISTSSIDAPDAENIVGDNLWVSTGWFDMRSSLNEPGEEFKEDIASLCKAAAFGGFTDVATLPNTKPVIQSKESIHFVKQMSLFQPVQLHPMGALTKDCKGEEMNEVTDMYNAGAVAFTDGTHSSWHLGVVKRAIMYMQGFDGLMIELADEKTLNNDGHMNEGIPSTLMGTRGIPNVAEWLAIQKILSLLTYTGGRVHFANISAAESVDLIRKAKTEGLQVTCDIVAHQVAFTDEDLSDFDTFKKVTPPFRSKADIEALWEGLKDGTIDAIVSSHTPLDTESKRLEFDLADAGIIGLETAFASIISNLPKDISVDLIIDKLTTSPRKILKVEEPKLEEGAKACLTVFAPETSWTFTENDIQSKSDNSPFIGKELKGKAVAIVNKGQLVKA
ncbi:dihydroorotase [Flammeovirga kamogawensis]|uniref:Dihydroorotase n=1 Tax=Flammeovirga kamogawensis TaxID=373891 RepID=A0ABX8GS77_9BACT|nr:dihydroorotase [Flammeovirga kamogawensis]MBB6461369.1 dihydroorotase [Flammeovirga kamogawensis]QWG06274.1 dihydroorotase [Flammeovirga kamogawensis]TRX68104.1 amidohydrolase family protein [Flammeovirga kamogawensis]